MPKLVTEFDGKIGGLTKAVSSAKSQLGGFAKSAASVGAGLAGFQSVESIIGKLGASIGKVANMSDAAANVGLTVEEYQKLGFAFRDVGLSSADADMAVTTMNQKIGEAIGGSEGANEALNKIGLTIDGIKNLSPAQQFETISKAIAKLPTQAERAAAGMDFFGKSGKKMDQLVMGFDAIMAKAVEAGNIIGGETADAADKLGDELAKLDDAFTALVANSGLIEFLSSAVKGMVDLQNSIKGGVDALLTMEGKLKDIGGKDVSGDATNAYRDLGKNAAKLALQTLPGGQFLTPLVDELIPEPQGAQITTNKTTDAEVAQFKKEQDEKARIAKEAVAKKAAMESAAKEKLGEKERKKAAKEAADKAKDDRSWARFQKEQEQAVVDARRESEERNKGGGSKAIVDLEREIDLQKLLNEGKAREAAVQEATNKAKDLSFSDEEAAAMGALAGQKFDLSQQVKPQYGTEHSDALLRIGGQIGRTGNERNTAADLQKKTNDLLNTLNRNLIEQTRKWEEANRENK